MKNLSNVIQWCIENVVSIVFWAWILSTVFDISFTIKHTDNEIKLSVETPVKKNNNVEVPSVTEELKPSW